MQHLRIHPLIKVICNHKMKLRHSLIDRYVCFVSHNFLNISCDKIMTQSSTRLLSCCCCSASNISVDIRGLLMLKLNLQSAELLLT